MKDSDLSQNSAVEESGASNYEFNSQNAISNRATKIPEKYIVFELYSTYSFIAGDDVLTFKDAMQSAKWTEALKRELNSLKKMNTWTEVDLPKNETAIDIKWVFRSKNDGLKKALLVARSFQEKSFSSSELCAPVARLSTVRKLISLALQNY
ncbi:hypothetical protein AVEN_201366-1 [Araneus ventricosus]|uniref:Reverse transcriptase Ty1/copia-type domain-containing protein n=1 Tax=Araneus ventricosus TaxID=182803 RepID=A0A4Y2UMB7_ARAVE|nr:hypothetical protein AVEN_201366-1 [Araneus ventricosus]